MRTAVNGYMPLDLFLRWNHLPMVVILTSATSHAQTFRMNHPHRGDTWKSSALFLLREGFEHVSDLVCCPAVSFPPFPLGQHPLSNHFKPGIHFHFMRVAFSSPLSIHVFA